MGEREKPLSGLGFLREYAQEAHPIHLAVIAIAGGGSMAAEAIWVATSVLPPGWPEAAVALAWIAAQTLICLAALGMPAVQKWVRGGKP